MWLMIPKPLDGGEDIQVRDIIEKREKLQLGGWTLRHIHAHGSGICHMRFLRSGSMTTACRVLFNNPLAMYRIKQLMCHKHYIPLYSCVVRCDL